MTENKRRYTDYLRDDALVRAAVSLGADAKSEDDLRERFHLDRATAFRAWQLRRAACADLLAWWIEGLLTLRDAERIATQDPFDADKQRASAAQRSSVIRSRLRSV